MTGIRDLPVLLTDRVEKRIGTKLADTRRRENFIYTY